MLQQPKLTSPQNPGVFELSWPDRMGTNNGFTCSKTFTTSTQLIPPAMQRKRVKHVRLGGAGEASEWTVFLGVTTCYNRIKDKNKPLKNGRVSWLKLQKKDRRWKNDSLSEESIDFYWLLGSKLEGQASFDPQFLLRRPLWNPYSSVENIDRAVGGLVDWNLVSKALGVCFQIQLIH